MAGFASAGGSSRSGLLHPFVKLPFVDVLVTTGTAQVLPVVDEVLRLELSRFLVTVAACDRDVSPGQRKTSLLVLGQGKGRGYVGIEVMALVTGIEVGCRRELTRVAILVAICAKVKLHPVERVLAFGDMALLALEACMASLEGVLRRRVFLHCE